MSRTYVKSNYPFNDDDLNSLGRYIYFRYNEAVLN